MKATKEKHFEKINLDLVQFKKNSEFNSYFAR